MKKTLPGAVPQPYVPDISLSRQQNLSSELTDLPTAIRLSAGSLQNHKGGEAGNIVLFQQ